MIMFLFSELCSSWNINDKYYCVGFCDRSRKSHIPNKNHPRVKNSHIYKTLLITGKFYTEKLNIGSKYDTSDVFMNLIVEYLGHKMYPNDETLVVVIKTVVWNQLCLSQQIYI